MFTGVPSSFPGPLTRAHPCFSPLPLPQIFSRLRRDRLLLLVGDAWPPPPPDPEEIEPPMLPPYGHDVNPRCCSYPLLMLSACLDRASLAMYTGIERLHGTLCRSGGAHGHGTGPWDDITGVVKRGMSSCLCRHCERIRANSSSRRLYGWASMGVHHRPMVEYASEIQSEYWSLAPSTYRLTRSLSKTSSTS